MTAPYYSDGSVTLYLGRMEDVLPDLGQFDACITDPPYGETSLEWDRWPAKWPSHVAEHTKSLWCFGSMRMFLAQRDEFAGWKFAQDVIWEKHNGSGFAADRFRRVHEIACQFYSGDWGDLNQESVRDKHHGPHVAGQATASRTPHTEKIGPHSYEDDGKRMTRSVVKTRSMHGHAIHPTEKPGAILDPLIRYSVPAGGSVLDPFAGSGSTLLTARSLGRKAVGVEASEAYCEAAAKRLSIPDLFGGVA